MKSKYLLAAIAVAAGISIASAELLGPPTLFNNPDSRPKAECVEIELWPDGAPTKNGLEDVSEKVKDNRISDVSKPVMYVYKAENGDGRMIIDCPGGGYQRLAFAHEGTDMADWFNSMGITYAVLKYRMPNGVKEVPLEDGRRAIELARSHAEELGIDPKQVGIMGGSAGGHFAATLATMYGDDAHRPDFQILLYPVISMGDITHRGSRDHLLGPNPSAEDIETYSLANRVDAKTPPAFIAVSADDKAVPVQNSLEYASALASAGVPVSLHVFPIGGHGWGFRDSFQYKQLWTSELAHWLGTLRN